MDSPTARAPASLVRWSVGVLLVTWRYLWATAPLHRSTQPGDARDGPPPLPEHLTDPHSQPLPSGTGPLYHRLFTVDITGASRSADQLIAELAADLNKAVPGEVTSVESPPTELSQLRVGKEMTVRIPGPWDGPVRVIHHDATSFRLATLDGHLEAGQIEFRAREHPDRLRFEIETWARPATRTVHVLYTRLWIAREIQLNMWVRCCLSAARLANGHPDRGVTIRTRVVGEPSQLIHHTRPRDQEQTTMPADTFPFRFTTAYRLAGWPACRSGSPRPPRRSACTPASSPSDSGPGACTRRWTTSAPAIAVDLAGDRAMVPPEQFRDVTRRLSLAQFTGDRLPFLGAQRHGSTHSPSPKRSAGKGVP